MFVCSCYGAESGDIQCCNTCEEVREAYRKKGWAISNPKVSLVRRGEKGGSWLMWWYHCYSPACMSLAGNFPVCGRRMDGQAQGAGEALAVFRLHP